jgi:hypothetical protein
MEPISIIDRFIKKDQKIIHFGKDSKELLTSSTPTEYTSILLTENFLEEINSVKNNYYDTVIIDELLETISCPQELIKSIRAIGKTTCIYEFKYDDDCIVKDYWLQPWKEFGLEFFLTREFDYVNSVFLGYATLHICEMPHDETYDHGVAQ